MDELICHCFGFTAGDIRRDWRTNGRSTIMEKIQHEKTRGACRCTEKNPRGR